MAQPNSGIMPDAIRLLRLPAVLARTGLSRSCLYSAVRAGTFPKPRRVAQRASAWVDREVDAWVAERVAGLSPLSQFSGALPVLSIDRATRSISSPGEQPAERAA